MNDPNINPNKREFYEKVFSKYDTDGSGTIEFGELKQMLKSDDEVPQKIVKKLFKYSDKDDDNRINLNEFITMIHDRKLKDLFGHYVRRYVDIVVPRHKRYKPVGRRGDVGQLELETSQIDGVYDESYSLWPPPLGIIIITIVEIICFIIDQQKDQNSEKLGSGMVAQVLIYDPYKRIQCWRFLTYMCVHIGWTHLIVNIIVQLCVAIPLELVNHWRVLVVYSLGVITGSLFTSITDPNTFLAGASGGVYALLTAHIATIIINWKDMAFAAIHLAIILIIVTIDLGTAIYHRYFLKLVENIGYSAHFGGAIAGLLVGIWMLKNVVIIEKEKYLQWAAILIYFILFSVLILLNIFWKSHFPKSFDFRA